MSFTIQITESCCHCVVVTTLFCSLQILVSLLDMEMSILNEALCDSLNYPMLL
jgi:hypothetical protein